MWWNINKVMVGSGTMRDHLGCPFPPFSFCGLSSGLLLDWSPISLWSSWNVLHCTRQEKKWWPIIVIMRGFSTTTKTVTVSTVSESREFLSLGVHCWFLPFLELWVPQVGIMPFPFFRSSTPVIPHHHSPILFFLAGSHSSDIFVHLPDRVLHSSST